MPAISKFLALVLASGLVAPQGWTQEKKAAAKRLSAEEKEAFEAVIREYLLKNPGVIREAIQALRMQEENASQDRFRKAVGAERAALLDDKEAGIMGNPQGDVSMALFFDYRCGYCKQILPALTALVEKDPKVRIVLKEFPILGPESMYAAKAALSARRYGKYLEFHKALMISKDLSEAGVKATAEKVGLDPKFATEMNSPEIASLLAKNMTLAQKLEIGGTPAIVIGDRLIPGAVNAEALLQLVNAERAKTAKETK